MAKILLSVPHTGTRFTDFFLKHIGVIYRQIHVDQVHRLEQFVNPQLIIPMRDPILCWCSHYLNQYKTAATSKEKWIKNQTDLTTEYWATLRVYGDKGNTVYLRLDAEDRIAELQAVADFCGSEMPVDKFVWECIGGTEGRPRNYDLWESVKETFTEDEIEYLETSLSPLRKKYV